jgi:uncharacterized protein
MFIRITLSLIFILMFNSSHSFGFFIIQTDTIENNYAVTGISDYFNAEPDDEIGSTIKMLERKSEVVTLENKSVNFLPLEKSRISAFIGEGEFHQTPYYILEGKQSGPVMIIHGGMHGDERASFLSLDRILENIKIIRGKLIIVPRINRPASEQMNRWYNNIPTRDFNHYFPGRNFSRSPALMNNYEYTLANQFMDLIHQFEPEIVVNLHEDKDKFFKTPGIDTVYNDPENLGQTIYTAERPISKELLQVVRKLNSQIRENDYQFVANSVIDRGSKQRGNLLEYLVDEVSFNGKKVRSYTLETYRNESVRGVRPAFANGFTLEDRVKLQMLVVLSFLETFGLNYTYNGGSEAINELTRLTPIY